MLLGQTPQDADPIDLRHDDVEHQHFGIPCSHDDGHLGVAAGFAHQASIGLRQPPDRLPIGGVVVDDQQTACAEVETAPHAYIPPLADRAARLAGAAVNEGSVPSSRHSGSRSSRSGTDAPIVSRMR